MSILHASSSSSIELPSWTDSLPVCTLSGVGENRNEVYRENGTKVEDHQMEDRSFHFRQEETGLALYGVIDGFEGHQAAHIASERFPAEMIMGQVETGSPDAAVIDALKQAFLEVEQCYFSSIDSHLAEQTRLRMQLNELGVSLQQAYMRHPDICSLMEQLQPKIAGGASAVIALIIGQQLFVANAGNCRALLCCQTDRGGSLSVYQLTQEHTLSNSDELARLAQLGLAEDAVEQWRQQSGDQQRVTRCIGDYYSKGGLDESPHFRGVRQDPVIVQPDVCQPVELSAAHSFLLLASGGLIKTLQTALDTEKVNSELASMTLLELQQQSTLSGVAQAVVHRIGQLHHDRYIMGEREARRAFERHEDLTLLVRNLNHPFPSPRRPSSTSSSLSSTHTNTQRSVFGPSTSSGTVGNLDNLPDADTLASSQLSSSSYEDSTRTGNASEPAMVLDEDGRIKPYVDLSAYFDGLQKLGEEERKKMLVEMELKIADDTIPEGDEEAEKEGKDGAGAQ